MIHCVCRDPRAEVTGGTFVSSIEMLYRGYTVCTLERHIVFTFPSHSSSEITSSSRQFQGVIRYY